MGREWRAPSSANRKKCFLSTTVRCTWRCSGWKTKSGFRAKWGVSENNRKARFYSLTAKGREQLMEKASEWRRLTRAMGLILDPARRTARRGGVACSDASAVRRTLPKRSRLTWNWRPSELREEGLSDDEAGGKRGSSSASARGAGAVSTCEAGGHGWTSCGAIFDSDCGRCGRAPGSRSPRSDAGAWGGREYGGVQRDECGAAAFAAGRRSADRVVYLRTTNPPRGTGTIDSNETFSYAGLRCAAQAARGLSRGDGLCAAVGEQGGGPFGAQPEEAEGDMVSGTFFSGLGVKMPRGRGFTEQDETDHAPIAVISYNYWTRRFARRSGCAGKDTVCEWRGLDHRRRGRGRI